MAVDISRVQRTVLDQAIRQARELQAAGRSAEAAAAWEHAARQADAYAASAPLPAERERRQQVAREILQQATRLRQPVPAPRPPRAPRDAATSSNASGSSETTEATADTDEFREAARRLIHKSSVSFQDIAGLETTKADIQSAFAMAFAKAPAGVHVPRIRNLLFYGPAGCGKTLLAAAASNGLDATFFAVKVSDLMSRYYGDSPKLVQALYEEARSHGHAVIFLDEFDALAASRSSDDSSADRRLLVSLLTELDGLTEKGGDSHVITIAATNRPWDLDEAILSRFEKSTCIPLPDAAARKALLHLQLENRGFTVQIPETVLLEQTSGLSGREISHLCKLMIEAMMHEANPRLNEVSTGGIQALQQYQLQIIPLQERHLLAVRNRIQKNTSDETLKLCECWGR